MKLINPLPAVDKYVYHYTKLNTALNYILKSGTLMFNSFAKVNDPRENKTWTIATWIRSSIKLELEDWDALSERVSKILKQNAKMVCFSKDREAAVSQWQPRALLDRGFTRPSMWHHYADAHNGVCLMFDVEKLNTAFENQVDQAKLFAGPVVYSDNGILLQPGNDPFSLNLTGAHSEQQFMNEIRGHLRQWMQNLFFRKLKDWQSEEEFRWVYFDENSTPLLLTFDDALEGIIIGENVPKEHEEAFFKYCVLYEAEITDLEWRNGYPAIVHPGQPYITHKHLLNT